MSLLTIHPEDQPKQATRIRDHARIAERLSEIGVLFEQWTANHPLTPEASQEEILTAYEQSINCLLDRYEFKSSDVINMQPDHPQKAEMRLKFLQEHTHGEFEVRFFVEGKGLFYLHAGQQVFVVLCEQGDLISVPAGTRHWFDMGENPQFKCIRLFTNPDGWIARLTGDPIASRFPTLEAYVDQYL